MSQIIKNKKEKHFFLILLSQTLNYLLYYWLESEDSK